ncbi:MAG TPA: hypothetical protein VFQ62_01950 [Methylomirabilota bacterium]|nr:hypothetical protein [Methylomirabilota bacterium]
MKTFRPLTLATTVLATALATVGVTRAQTPAAPQTQPTMSDDEHADMLSDLELTRAAIQVRRQALVTAVMDDLNAKEAEAFWPLYRDYRGAMAGVSDRYVKLMTNYLNSLDNLTDSEANGMLKDYISIERARLDVKSKFIPRFNKVLPAKKVARFFQIDNKLDAVIAADMAKLIPLAK